MIKPEVLHKDQDYLEIGQIFGAPLGVTPDVSALPLNEVIVSIGLARWSRFRHPGRSWKENLLAGTICMLVTLGSEWAHNLAHTLVAKLIGKPPDAIRIVFGMPLLVYHDLHDPDVTPKQHLIRASGGPLFNLLALPLTWLWKKSARKGSISRDAADAAFTMNAFLISAGMLPIPGLDGGVIMKWAAVTRGQTISEADETVRKANLVSGTLLAGASGGAFLKKKWLLGGLFGVFGVLSLVIGKGWLKEY